MGLDITTDHETQCPYCDRRHSQHSGPKAAAVPGALAVCIDCGEIAVFTDALVLRPITNAEWLAAPSNLRRWLARVRDHIRTRGPTTAR